MDQTKRSLIAVGLGPGDPELITLKGLRAIEAAELIFVPRSRDGGLSYAERIVSGYLREDQQIIRLPLPMVRNAAELVPAWENGAQAIVDAYAQFGATNGVYLLLGDPLLFGTFIYLAERIPIRDAAMQIDVIPGVTSFAATAAKANFTLATTDDRIAILPASYETDLTALKELMTHFDTVIFLKAGTVLAQLLAAVDELGLTASTIYGEKVGMPEETLVTDVSTLAGQNRPYLSLLIVRKTAES